MKRGQLQLRTSKLSNNPSGSSKTRHERASASGIPVGSSIKNWDPSEDSFDVQILADLVALHSPIAYKYGGHLNITPSPKDFLINTAYSYGYDHPNTRQMKACKGANFSHREALQHDPKLDGQDIVQPPKHSPKLEVYHVAHSNESVDAFGRQDLAIWKQGTGRSKEWRCCLTNNEKKIHTQYRTERKQLDSKDTRFVETVLPCALLRRNSQIKAKPNRARPLEDRACRKKEKKEALRQMCKLDSRNEVIELRSVQSSLLSLPIKNGLFFVSYKDQSITRSYLPSSPVLIDLLGTIFKERYLLRTFLGQLRCPWGSVSYNCDIYDVEDFQRQKVHIQAYVLELKGQSGREREDEAYILRRAVAVPRYPVFSCQRQRCLIAICRPNSWNFGQTKLDEVSPLARFSAVAGSATLEHTCKSSLNLERKSTTGVTKRVSLTSSNNTGPIPSSVLIRHLVACALSKEECKMIKAEQSSLRYIFGEDCMGYIAKEIARDELHRKGKARTKQWRKRRERRENKRINSELELPILVEYS